MTTSMAAFKRTIWSHYRKLHRDMPWREDITPYRVVISEMMLQQTQVSRVMKKFGSWMRRFPDWRTLARASTRDVLREWSGLGYNRRALYLKRIAETIVSNEDYSFLLDGRINQPSNLAGMRLSELPGIGENTAGAILSFAYNIPCPFIETNIRSVFIHFFFPDVEKKEGHKARKKIRDAELMPFIEKALADKAIAKNPREWHYALMDYGSYLKSVSPNPSRRSARHVKQSPFRGSNRELRGKILRLATERSMDRKEIGRELDGEYPPARIRKAISDLTKEGFDVL